MQIGSKKLREEKQGLVEKRTGSSGCSSYRMLIHLDWCTYQIHGRCVRVSSEKGLIGATASLHDQHLPKTAAVKSCKPRDYSCNNVRVALHDCDSIAGCSVQLHDCMSTGQCVPVCYASGRFCECVSIGLNVLLCGQQQRIHCTRHDPPSVSLQLIG